MLFADSRQTVIMLIIAFAMLWLAIQYHENHSSPPANSSAEPRRIPDPHPSATSLRRLRPSVRVDEEPAIFDPEVRETAAYAPVLAAAAMTAGGETSTPRITKITSGSLSFAAPASDGWYWLSSGNLAVAGDQTPAGATVTLNLLGSGGVQKELKTITVDANGSPWTIDTGAPLPAGDQRLSVHIKTSDNKESDTPPVSVHVPTDGDPPPATVSHVFNAKHAVDPTPSGANGVLLYGPSPYLRLEGQDFAANTTKLRFFLFDNTSLLKQEITNARVTRDPKIPGAWRAEMNLPAAPTAQFKVLAMSQAEGGKYNYSTSPTQVSIADFDSDPSLKQFAINKVVINSDQDAKQRSDGAYLVNGGDVKLSGGVPTDTDVLLVAYRDGDANPLAVTAPTATGWELTLRLPEGAQRVKILAEQSDKTIGNSKPLAFLVRNQGPRVQKIEPANFGTAPGYTSLTLYFNPENPLDLPATPTPAGVFQVLGSNGSGVFDRGSETILIFESDQAKGVTTFDEQRNAVNLRFAAAPPVKPDIYQLRIIGSAIKDKFGNQLEGAPGKPGTDYIKVLGQPTGEITEAAPPTVAPGIHGATGPYVPYPEYTPPRPETNGFNPSDHVETRVSRLYYYRDAHRVAQIINRTAKSYNRAAVDMQRQLADKARTIADQATDDRKAKERAAVEASKQTREAEHQLQQAEATLSSAVQEARRAQGQLNSLTNQSQQSTAPAGGGQAGGNAAPAGNGAGNTQNAAQIQQLQGTLASLNAVAENARQRAQAAYQEVQRRRAAEVQATEEWQAATAVEDRAREEQFRREVAAAHEDPDTYAPGKPDSIDPVRQVSLSVIGEGVIQLRGPMKGINECRMMIHQIDSPVGQVNVAVHTVQVNGEKGNRMERVAERIQTYIDHSRFLTLESAEMLRKAIFKVAAAKAVDCGDLPGLTQADRDRKYLDSFFGADFIQELAAMDSEFLRTGNKLLSLNSMDSTSLQSALFLMALAKNSTRLAILAEFEAMMVAELPMAEQRYLEAGMTCDCKYKLFCKHHHAIQLLANNAKFESLRGFFDVEVGSDDTMTPIQREFTRLAQIFKSRLIVELQLNQRVTERAMIEERLGNYQEELKTARKKDQRAQANLSQANAAAQEARKGVLNATQVIQARVYGISSKAEDVKKTAESNRALLDELIDKSFSQLSNIYMDTIEKLESKQKNKELTTTLLKTLDDGIRSIKNPANNVPIQQLIDKLDHRLFDVLNNVLDSRGEKAIPTSPLPTILLQGTLKGRMISATLSDKGLVVDPASFDFLKNELQKAIADGYEAQLTFKGIHLEELSASCLKKANSIYQSLVDNYHNVTESNVLDSLKQSVYMGMLYGDIASEVEERAGEVSRSIDFVVGGLAKRDSDLARLYQTWRNIEDLLREHTEGDLQNEVEQRFPSADEAFETLLSRRLDEQFAEQEAVTSRRPLDHKKFLDMLIDEMEDKYIELLEGTRAHTANIDAYIKRIVTALNDDYNTQFYYPAFREVRRASRMWDVTMGQIESTSILANNRAFAKVSPQATMEFDLPKRDIVIAEAMNGAKAAIDDFGALVQDPTFVGLTKLGSGQPTSSLAAGNSGGLASVRDVLPGLSTDTAEQVMAQHGPGGQKLGTALESLIPDPAVYKFETGTGFEIRPVIQPDGQAVTFHLNYMYTTNVREPVRADEKHLGRVKRHFIDTDVQLSNYELREVSKYSVALKAARTSQGVPLLQDIPVAGILFRPLPSAESSLQENIILAQATIFPTLFDLMGLRWAPAVADLDPLRLENDEFLVRSRRQALMNRVYDYSSSQVDEFLRIPEAERRSDLYRSQETIPAVHPNGYRGSGLNFRDSQLREGYDPTNAPQTQFVPSAHPDGNVNRRNRGSFEMIEGERELPLLDGAAPPVHETPELHGPQPEPIGTPPARAQELPSGEAAPQSSIDPLRRRARGYQANYGSAEQTAYVTDEPDRGRPNPLHLRTADRPVRQASSVEPARGQRAPAPLTRSKAAERPSAFRRAGEAFNETFGGANPPAKSTRRSAVQR